MKIGCYDPYAETLGGGEKYLFTIIETAIADGHEVTLLSPVRPKLAAWKRLNVSVPAGTLRWQHADDRSFSEHSRVFERVIVLHNEIPPRSLAPSSMAIIQFPFRTRALGRKRDWLKFPTALQQRRSDVAALRSYQQFFCYSQFVKQHIQKRFGVTAAVLPPPVDLPPAQHVEKRPVIVAVGRFFEGGHNKKHDVMIAAFRTLTEQLGDRHWELHLVGGADQSLPTKRYLARLRRQARRLPVRFQVNASLQAVQTEYARASLFWHAAGFGESAHRYPERLEHFGITTVEAMLAGCVPVVIDAGGQSEIVEDGVTGYVWSQPDQLVSRSLRCIDNAALRNRLSDAAKTAGRRYAKARFVTAVKKQLLT